MEHDTHVQSIYKRILFIYVNVLVYMCVLCIIFFGFLLFFSFGNFGVVVAVVGLPDFW